MDTLTSILYPQNEHIIMCFTEIVFKSEEVSHRHSKRAAINILNICGRRDTNFFLLANTPIGESREESRA